jgi:hypothetical protein
VLKQLRIHERKPDKKERALLAKEPERDPAMHIVIDCWFDLDTCRPTYESPIPWTAIVEWVRAHRLDRQWLQTLSGLIRHLDISRLDRIASERRTKEKARDARNQDQGRSRKQRAGR